MKNLLRVLYLFLAALLVLVVCFEATYVRADFAYSGEYLQGRFHDVSENQWFSQYVEDAYNFGLIRGKDDDMFDPGGLLTIGEAVTLAARIRSIHHTGKAEFTETIPYYKVYADYAITHGIIEDHEDFSLPATRARFASIMYNALPPEAFPAINSIPDYIISDVTPESDYGEAVYALYRAGVLSGTDRFGTFFPDSYITRAQVSAVLVRLVHPASRLNVKLPDWLPAEVIYQRSVDAVVTIETFTGSGRSIRTGSGFFINNEGHIVTAMHVLDNAKRATVTLLNGDVYPVRGVLASSLALNLVILVMDSDEADFSYLNIADSDLVEIGNTVYALGNPWDFTNTISEGIVSHTSREVDYQTLIMFTAPISFGSGGGPILNARGQVIGIASLSFRSGQNLNLAIHAKHIKALVPDELIPLENWDF